MGNFTKVLPKSSNLVATMKTTSYKCRVNLNFSKISSIIFILTHDFTLIIHRFEWFANRIYCFKITTSIHLLLQWCYQRIVLLPLGKYYSGCYHMCKFDGHITQQEKNKIQLSICNSFRRRVFQKSCYHFLRCMNRSKEAKSQGKFR